MPSKKNYNSRFPPARIKKIMQMDEDVGKVAAPVPVIISRVLEMFVEHTLRSASMLAEQNHCRTLLSSHLSQALASEERLHFLMETVRQHAKSEVPGSSETEAPTSSKCSLPSAAHGSGAGDSAPESGAPAGANTDGGGRVGVSSSSSSGASARGERGRGKPRGRPSKRSAPADIDVSSGGQDFPSVKRGRGRPRKNLNCASTSFPTPIVPPLSSGARSPSTPITFSIGSTTPTTPLPGGVGVSIPGLPTTPTPVPGLSFGVPGGAIFSLPSPSTPGARSCDGVAPSFDQNASQGQVSTPGPPVTFEASQVHSMSPIPGVTLSFGLPSSKAKDGVSSGTCGAGGLGSIGGASLHSKAPTSGPQKEHTSVADEEPKRVGVIKKCERAAPVGSLSVENSPLGQIKIEVPAFFPGPNSPSVITSASASVGNQKSTSSKVLSVGNMDAKIPHPDQEKIKEEGSAFKKENCIKLEADSESADIKNETKSSSQLKENDESGVKASLSFKSAIPQSNGMTALPAKPLWGCDVPVSSWYSSPGVYTSSKADNSDEDYDN